MARRRSTVSTGRTDAPRGAGEPEIRGSRKLGRLLPMPYPHCPTFRFMPSQRFDSVTRQHVFNNLQVLESALSFHFISKLPFHPKTMVQDDSPRLKVRPGSLAVGSPFR